jgi:hypothetical protein
VATIPFMIAFLPSTGGMGAAVISTAGSFLSLALLARYTLAMSDARVRDLVPHHADVVAIGAIMVRLASRSRSG